MGDFERRAHGCSGKSESRQHYADVDPMSHKAIWPSGREPSKLGRLRKRR